MEPTIEPIPDPLIYPPAPKRRLPCRLIVLISLGAALTLCLAGIGAFVIYQRLYLIKIYYIPSEAMEPTLMGHDKGHNPATDLTYPDSVHDRILVDRTAYKRTPPARGDIVAFLAEKKADKAADLEHRDPVEFVLVKRVVGIRGDTIEFRPDASGVMRVYVNSRALNEPYIKEPMSNPQPSIAEYGVRGPLTLHANELYVLGDNRNNSNDSRFWGTLPISRVIGKAVSILDPPERRRELQ